MKKEERQEVKMIARKMAWEDRRKFIADQLPAGIKLIAAYPEGYITEVREDSIVVGLSRSSGSKKFRGDTLRDRVKGAYVGEAIYHDEAGKLQATLVNLPI